MPSVVPPTAIAKGSLEGARTLYGATKLAAEHLICEYAETYGVQAVIDRCGVVAGLPEEADVLGVRRVRGDEVG